MYIELEDLICYMDCYSSAFFNLNTYELYFGNELPLNVDISEMLQVPQIEETEIMKEFMKTRPILYMRRIDDMGYISVCDFHDSINKYGIYDEWIEFRFDYLRAVALNWCHLNNIKCTKKQVNR